MVSLKSWMRREAVSDAAMADKVGLSVEGIRKLKFGKRGASGRVSAAVFRVTGGEVGPPDLLPRKSRPSPERARPCM